jgi:hypothetical protein
VTFPKYKAQITVKLKVKMKVQDFRDKTNGGQDYKRITGDDKSII